MPNWCQNTLIIIGSPTIIDKFKVQNSYDGKELSLSFEKGVYPEGIAENDIPMWRVMRWGTKRDLDSADKPLISTSMREDGEKELIYEFDTAWSPPIDWLINISMKYPSLEYKLEYEEKGMDESGFLEVIAGETVSEDTWSPSEKTDRHIVECVRNLSIVMHELDPINFYDEIRNEMRYGSIDNEIVGNEELMEEIYNRVSDGVEGLFEYYYEDANSFSERFVEIYWDILEDWFLTSEYPVQYNRMENKCIRVC